MRLSVIIPVFNEVDTLRKIVERVRAVDIPKEIILVDDYSTDGTRELYDSLRPMVDKIVLHDRNRGKGAAIRTGLEHVTGDVVIIQDADLEYDPQEYHLLLEPILAGRADAVYGSRFLTGRAHRVLYFWHMVGNKFLTLLSNMFTNLTLTDMETCYKMVRTDIMRSITIEQDRFGFEPEITAKLAKLNIRIYEVGISYAGRSYAEGKKIGWKDGLNAIWCILKYSRGRYLDHGKRTLKTLQEFDGYARWIFSRLRPYLGSRIMEIGTGIGNNVRHLLANPGTSLILTEYRPDYVDLLRERFGHRPNVQVFQYDATQPPAPELAASPPDSIVCLNVLEHIEQDQVALRNMYDLLQPGGRLMLLVPAHDALYCAIDRNLDHHRRYSRDLVQQLLHQAGFNPIEIFYFNPLGAIGWFVAGKILRAQCIKPYHVRIQRMLLPLGKVMDRVGLPFGLSVVAVAEKPASSPQ
ncbi:MAG: glycosyltransferase [Candidatus Sumerlaeaceae bacterium]|nr:glycosyltransferase [Candidatus Sumerlaeaceae bacterium]